MLFSYRSLSVNPLLAILAMNNYSSSQGADVRVQVLGNALIHRSRNEAMSKIRDDSDFVLFLDDDMAPQQDAMMKLLERNKPVIAPMCTTRIPPIVPVVKMHDPNSGQWLHPPAPPPPDTVITGWLSLGAAFLLMDRPTIEALKEHYLSARDWAEDNRRMFDRMHIRSDQREKERARREEIRRARWERDRQIRIWDFPVGDDELQLGEDVAMARKLHQLGIQSSLDTGISVGHVGEYPYGPWDIDWEERGAVGAA